MNAQQPHDDVQKYIDQLNHWDDAHKALGLNVDASEEEIIKRYRFLRKRVHPDKNNGRQDATEAFQKLQNYYNELTNAPGDTNNDNFPNKEPYDEEMEEDQREFEKYQEWRREWEREYTETLFRRTSGRLEHDTWRFYMIFISILAVFMGIGFLTIQNATLKHLKKSYLSPEPYPVSHLSNKTVFSQECFQTKNKSCVILFLPGPGLCSEKMNEKSRQYFEKSLQKIKNHDLGRLWSHHGNQQEIEKSVAASNDTIAPFILFANFNRATFWTKRLQDYKDPNSIRGWIKRCSNGEEKNQFNIDTSKWSKWSSKMVVSIPKIITISKEPQWNSELGKVVVRLLPEICYFLSF